MCWPFWRSAWRSPSKSPIGCLGHSRPRHTQALAWNDPNAPPRRSDRRTQRPVLQSPGPTLNQAEVLGSSSNPLLRIGGLEREEVDTCPADDTESVTCWKPTAVVETIFSANSSYPTALGDVPNSQGAIRFRGDRRQPCALRAEVTGIHRSSLCFEHRAWITARRVPQSGGAVSSGGGQPLVVWADGAPVDLAGMASQDQSRLAGSRLPSPCGAVRPGGGQPGPVSAECAPVDGTDVASQYVKHLTRFRVPDSCGSVRTGGGEPGSVRADGASIPPARSVCWASDTTPSGRAEPTQVKWGAPTTLMGALSPSARLCGDLRSLP